MSKATLPLAVLLAFAPFLGLPFSNPQTSPPPARSSPEEVRRYFSEEEAARGRLYMWGRYALFFVGLGLKVAFLLLLIVIPASKALERFAFSLAFGKPWLAVIVYTLVLLLLYTLLFLPLSAYRDLFRERAFGLSVQTIQGWLLDQLKGFLLSAVLLPPLVLLLYALIRRFPETWYLPAGLAASFLIVFFTAISPILIEPIFHTFRPIQNEDLRARVTALAEKAGLQVEKVLEMDASRRTRKLNAYVSGLGKTKRVVLYDTLVKGSSPEEVELVLAHELGHWKHQHLWKGVGLAALFAFAGLFVGSLTLHWGVQKGLIQHPADLAWFPLLLLTLFLFHIVTLPVENAISRAFERQADYASLLLTKNPEAFIRSEVQLAKSNLADLTPPRPLVLFLYTHPPVLERIGMAETFQQEGR
ncbi:MAG: M48 family metallopeptidase [candidate division NC10 bacterium]|nr:M48 family metallopeptidase [candidate division NC10 bacterium]